MKAKQFYNKVLSKIKGGYTTKVAINRARKHNLRDTNEEIFFYTGMTCEQSIEFSPKIEKTQTLQITRLEKAIDGLVKIHDNGEGNNNTACILDMLNSEITDRSIAGSSADKNINY